jgi:hypothetical protein
MTSLLVFGIVLAVLSMVFAIAKTTRRQPWSPGSRAVVTVLALAGIACIVIGVVSLLIG